MRLSILPLLLTGVSAVNLVVAEPIRIVENPSNENANIRLGHALANTNVNGNDDNVAHIVRPTAVFVNISPKEKGLFRHLCGASLREKALRVSNAFRLALGLPLIEDGLAVARPEGVHVLPMPFPPPNVILPSHEELGEEGKSRKHHDDEHPDHLDDGEDHEHRPHHGHHGRHGHHGHHGHHCRHHKYLKCFFKRIHKAIKALGPWEGRAVAFVLGCGIGVLLRMFWVLTVLAYRTVRGEREELLDREYIVYEQVPETLFAAPPEYVDEKFKTEAHEDEGHK